MSATAGVVGDPLSAAVGMVVHAGWLFDAGVLTPLATAERARQRRGERRCPSSALPTAATNCTDAGVSPGAHQYTVTAVWWTWKRASASANVTVTVGAATQLVFTTQPGNGATGGSAFPTPPVVTPVDAGGNTVSGDSTPFDVR